MKRRASIFGKFTPILIALLVIPLALGACAGGPGQPGAQNGQTQIGLNFPDGYTYDNTTHALYPPSGKTSAVMPPYVTGMTLTITGEDMDTQVLQIDLS
ncbi:MAG: hypothetical protein OEV92_09385, partial [Nitrospinota bacterium]|nr:hypothetical protein [Nitrospinota bacterium]